MAAMVNMFCSFTAQPCDVNASRAAAVKVPGAPELGSCMPNSGMVVTPVPTKLLTAFVKKPIDA